MLNLRTLAPCSRKALRKLQAAALALASFSLAGFAPAIYAQNASKYWHTRGAQILDSSNQPIRMHGVNWYGFETTNLVVGSLYAQDYRTILQAVKNNGYNVIRLPFSNQLIETNPLPAAGQISFSNASGPINTDLQGAHALKIMDKIIEDAGKLGLHVILNNHRSEAGSSAEATGLWYTADYPESSWLQDWATLAERYRNNPTVVGMDLRNEPHNAYAGGSCWTGDTNTAAAGCPVNDLLHNWPEAATRAGERIQQVNPYLLIFVEGVDEYDNNYYWNGGQLRGVAQYPVVLPRARHVVYSAHDYGPVEYQQPFFNSTTTYGSLSTLWDQTWGYISTNKQAPVWLGEFGTTDVATDLVSDVNGSQGQWFSSLATYVALHPNLSWTYWALNGSDRYGLLDPTYDPAPASPLKQAILSILQIE